MERYGTSQRAGYDEAARRRALRRVASFAFIFTAFALPSIAFAQALDPGLTGIQENIGLGGGDPRILIARVIRVLLGFLGIIGVGIVLYGGYLWMTAGGNSDQVATAQQVLRNGLIGLIIILLAFSIVSFLLRRFLNEGGGGGGGGGPNPPCANCVALGGGIIEDHYPGRNQKNVPRNTSIVITFREPIFVAPTADPSSASSFFADAVALGGTIDGVTCTTTWCGHLNTSVFGVDWDTGTGFASVLAGGHVKLTGYTNDEQTFIFQLQNGTLHGSPDRNSAHRATVRSALKKKNGTSALLGDYAWEFEVSTIIDTTPPRIVSVRPPDKELDAPRNSLVLITFDEPVNPVSATGRYDTAAVGQTFRNITVGVTGLGEPLAGVYAIGNGYRTVEFSTFSACGTNSCGNTIYCLPPNEDITATVLAASLYVPTCAPSDPLNNPSRACSPVPGVGLYDGVVDMADNSLDGGVNSSNELVFPTGNGKADGPPADNRAWNFSTNDTIVIGAPVISSVKPAPGVAKVSQDAIPEASFNRVLGAVRARQDFDGKVRNPIYIAEQGTGSAWAPYQGAFWSRQAERLQCTNDVTKSCAFNADCADTDATTFDLCGVGDLFINHSGFTKPETQPQKQYEPRLGSTIRDEFQNCFAPSFGPPNPAGVTPPVAYPNVPGDIFTPTL